MLIVDTAGRLHIDEELMDELAEIQKRTKPHNVLLVVDAMTGQDAVNVAEPFAETANFDGVILTKLDGDARGGAALSVKAVTGKPILYASTGEKLDDFERFHPDRMAQRILGMGDVMTLVEKAERQIDERQAQELERKIRKEQFTLDDFLEQMQQVRKMGPLQGLLKMMPGVGQQLGGLKVDDSELDRLQAIITSMTPEERANPHDHQRLAPAADRPRLGDHRPGRVPAGQAVRPDAEDDAPDRAGEDALPAAARGRSLTSPAYVRPSPAHARGQQEESDLARGRRRPALAARRRFIETIGHYNPQTEPSTIVIDERAPRALARAGRAADNTVKQLMKAQTKSGGPTPPTRRLARPRRRRGAEAAEAARRRRRRGGRDARGEPDAKPACSSPRPTPPRPRRSRHSGDAGRGGDAPTRSGGPARLPGPGTRRRAGRGLGRVVRGGGRDGRARAARGRGRRRQGDRPRRPHGRRAADRGQGVRRCATAAACWSTSSIDPRRPPDASGRPHGLDGSFYVEGPITRSPRARCVHGRRTRARVERRAGPTSGR